MMEYRKDIDTFFLKKVKDIDQKKKKDFEIQFRQLYDNIIKYYGLEYEIYLIQYIQSDDISGCKEYDGYTVTLQVDFLYKGKYIKIPYDDYQCSFFQNITYIQWIPILNKYSIYKSKNFHELLMDINGALEDIQNVGFVME